MLLNTSHVAGPFGGLQLEHDQVVCLLLLVQLSLPVLDNLLRCTSVGP